MSSTSIARAQSQLCYKKCTLTIMRLPLLLTRLAHELAELLPGLCQSLVVSAVFVPLSPTPTYTEGVLQCGLCIQCHTLPVCCRSCRRCNLHNTQRLLKHVNGCVLVPRMFLA